MRAIPTFDARRQILETWHWCQFLPPADRAYGAMRRVIEADAWCRERFGDDRFVRIDSKFCFESPEDLMQFKLTWL